MENHKPENYSEIAVYRYAIEQALAAAGESDTLEDFMQEIESMECWANGMEAALNHSEEWLYGVLYAVEEYETCKRLCTEMEDFGLEDLDSRMSSLKTWASDAAEIKDTARKGY